MKRGNAENIYKWDFSHLYQNIDAWKNELNTVKTQLLELTNFAGHLNDKNEFLKLINLEEAINFKITKLSEYLHYGDLDTTNLTFQELSGEFGNILSEMSVKLAFIEPEIKSLGWATVKQWLTEGGLTNYLYSYDKFFKHATHVLDTEQEELLSTVQRSRTSAFELYDLLAYADRKSLDITWKDKKQELTNSLYLQIMEDSDPHQDQIKRVETANLFVSQLVDKKHSLAKVYESILTYEVEETKLRNYPDTLTMALSGDEVSVDIYQALIKYGQLNSQLFVDYQTIIKNYFKLEKFYSTDQSLKLIKNYSKTYDVNSAKAIIRKALEKLGPEYLKQLEIAWGPNRIDYFEDTNKRDGAYSSGGYPVDPIILMNWDDKLNSVNTLAHEIGHSVHTILSDRHQKYPLNQYPIILAEVASTLNEHLLFDYLYTNSSDKNEKIYLLQNRITEIIGTFFRQIQFAAFELQAHQLVEQNQPLTADILADLFEKISNDFGYRVFDHYNPQSKPYGWTRVLHFFNSPYYVYKYATSIVSSFKLFQDVKANHNHLVLDFLKAGGSKPPLLILKSIGVDFTSPTVFDPLKDELTKMIKNLQELLEN